MEPIKVWKFEDAPEELRALSNDGEYKGYEEYIAVLPKDYVYTYGLPMFLNSATIGIKEVRCIKNGDEIILIGIRTTKMINGRHFQE